MLLLYIKDPTEVAWVQSYKLLTSIKNVSTLIVALSPIGPGGAHLMSKLV